LILCIGYQKKDNEIQYISYYEHSNEVKYTLDNIHIIGERVIVYIARYSHASYPKPDKL
jgi:hypothetical protein